MSKEPQESEYQNDIATLLKILKKTVMALDSILSQQQHNNDSSAMIYKISEQSKILLEVIKRQKSRNHQLHIMQISVHFRSNEKMKIRSREWLSDNRNKYANGYPYKDIRSFLQQIQIAFGIFEKNQEFVALVSKVYNIISDQLRIFKIKYDLFHHKHPQNMDSFHPKVRKTKSLILNTNFMPTQTTNLSLLYGLELDYMYLKTSAVHCRRNQLQFLQGQLQGNRLISKQIDDYMKEYYLMMNRIKVKRKHHSQLYSREVKSSIKNLRIKTTINDKLYHNFQVPKQGKRAQSKENRRQEPILNKLAYKINNVYVSGNEFDIYSDHSSQFLNANRPKKKAPSFLTRAIRDPLANRINNYSTKELIG